MNSRIWGIIGGAALVLALLSPLVLGSSQKVERLFEAAEILYERLDYEGAIVKYKEALKESKKLGAKTERIDKDFTILANLKIARCYYELAEDSSDIRHYQSALRYIKEVVLDAETVNHQEELIYLWAETLYKTGDLDQAKSKFSWLTETFPNSHRVEKALYMIGEINYQEENCEEALNAFQKLIDEFPYSDFIAEAEKRIAEIRLLIDGENSYEDTDEDEYIYQDQVMYQAASNLQQQGRVHDAYELYTDLIEEFPECEYVTDAYVGIAEIHLEAEDYVKAREYYEAAMYSTINEERTRELHEAYHRTYLVPEYSDQRIQPALSDELFVRARLLRNEERFLEASEIYERLANRSLPTEDIVYALYWSGRCYHNAALQNSTLTNERLFRKSVDAFEKLITDHENSSYDIKVYYYLALVYTDWAKVSGDPSKCQSVIDRVDEVNMEYADNDDTTVQGWLSRMQELKEEAHEKLSPPPDPLPEEAKRAIAEAEAAIASAKQENREPQLIHRANISLESAKQQMHRNNYTAALNQAKETLRIINAAPPPIPPIQRYVNEGHTYFRQGKLEEATKKAKQALSFDPNYSPAHELLLKIKQKYYGRGWTFFDEEQYNQAIDAFQDAISIDPKFKEAHNHLGVVYIKQEKYPEAIVALEEAINIDEAFKEAYFNLALAYLELDEFEAVKNAAITALRIDPNYEPADMIIRLIGDHL